MINRIVSSADYENKYKESVENPKEFWSKIAENFIWYKKWDEVVSWEFFTPKIEWFRGGKLNIIENLLDRNVRKHPNKIALIWEPNDPGDAIRKFTYNELKNEVCRFSNALKHKGVKKVIGCVFICLWSPSLLLQSWRVQG